MKPVEFACSNNNSSELIISLFFFLLLILFVSFLSLDTKRNTVHCRTQPGCQIIFSLNKKKKKKKKIPFLLYQERDHRNSTQPAFGPNVCLLKEPGG